MKMAKQKTAKQKVDESYIYGSYCMENLLTPFTIIMTLNNPGIKAFEIFCGKVARKKKTRAVTKCDLIPLSAP